MPAGRNVVYSISTEIYSQPRSRFTPLNHSGGWWKPIASHLRNKVRTIIRCQSVKVVKVYASPCSRPYCVMVTFWLSYFVNYCKVLFTVRKCLANLVANKNNRRILFGSQGDVYNAAVARHVVPAVQFIVMVLISKCHSLYSVTSHCNVYFVCEYGFLNS